MKYILLFILCLYQRIVSPALKQLLGMQAMCRFTPSCSEYAGLAIQKYGSVKGGYLAIERLLQCQPFQSQKSNIKSQNNLFDKLKILSLPKDNVNLRSINFKI